MDRRPLGFHEPSPIGLTAGLLGQGAEHRGGSSAALHRDEQAGRHEVTERIVDVVRETAEHELRILASKAGGQPADLRLDRRRTGGHRGVDRPDRLVAGDEHVTKILDPRGQRVGPLDLAHRCAVAALPDPHREPTAGADHERREQPAGDREDDHTAAHSCQ